MSSDHANKYAARDKATREAPKLRADVLEKTLERFGFSGVPDPDLEGLGAVYKAWSRAIGYDNVQKRVYYAEGRTGPFPNIDANDFLNAWMAHGTGGSCWPSAEAMFQILLSLGFDVRRVAGQMLDCDDPMKPNHGTVIATLDGVEYAVDTGMVGEVPLPLLRGVPTAGPSQAFGLWSTGIGDIWWRPGHSRRAIQYVTQFDPCTGEDYAEYYEKTKIFSLFNDVLYVRRNREDGIVTVGRGNRIVVTPDGEMSAVPIEPGDLTRILVEEMHLSEEIAAKIPADKDSVTFN